MSTAKVWQIKVYLPEACKCNCGSSLNQICKREGIAAASWYSEPACALVGGHQRIHFRSFCIFLSRNEARPSIEICLAAISAREKRCPTYRRAPGVYWFPSPGLGISCFSAFFIDVASSITALSSSGSDSISPIIPASCDPKAVISFWHSCSHTRWWRPSIRGQ